MESVVHVALWVCRVVLSRTQHLALLSLKCRPNLRLVDYVARHDHCYPCLESGSGRGLKLGGVGGLELLNMRPESDKQHKLSSWIIIWISLFQPFFAAWVYIYTSGGCSLRYPLFVQYCSINKSNFFQLGRNLSLPWKIWTFKHSDP